jgi:ubiquinone/menaquinone biosynthesis C-methylase UbiE
LKLIEQFKGFIDSQYSKPSGFLGIYIGEKMVKQHQPETLWAIKLLNPQRDENILELGCGAGNAIKLILQQSTVRQVIGLDISQSVLHSAAIRNRKEINKGRAKLIQGNVNKLTFQDGYFTKVFSIHSVYFWDNLSETISEIYRVLKPEGTIMITLCDGKNGETWDDIKVMIEQQIIPIMEQNKFKHIVLLKGPDSRQFQTVAIKGEK